MNRTTQLRMKKLFQDVIIHEFEEKDSKKYVKLKTSFEWNEGIAKAFQELVMDRNPLGYGGPFDFKCKKIEENLFIVTWYCYNVAD